MKRANKHIGKTDKQKGVAIVEFAIVLPLLAIVLLGIFEVGSIVRDYQILQNAAREGARFSALPNNRMDYAPNPTAVRDMIRTRVSAYLASHDITVPAGDINVDQAYPVQIDALTVMGSQITITYTRPLIFSGAAALIPGLGTLQLVGNAVFRNFY